MERRISARFENVPFTFQLQTGHRFPCVAEDASLYGARFLDEYEGRLSTATGGFFRLGNAIFTLSSLSKMTQKRNGTCVVQFEASRSAEAQIPEQEASFLNLQTNLLWDRYKQLEAENDSIKRFVIKIYVFMLLFAAAPFSLAGFLTTAFSRMWGFGGIWLALAAWFYCDRYFRAYGNNLFERVFCLKEMAQLREIVFQHSEAYNRYSLLPTQGDGSRAENAVDPGYITNSHLTYTAYFYKFLSLFMPMYLCVFLSMIIFPIAMLDAHVGTTRAMYLRVVLAFSFIFFVWLYASMRRCLGLFKDASRARRITVNRPWPQFPREEDLDLFPGQRYLQRGFPMVASLLGFFNLALFGFRYVEISKLGTSVSNFDLNLWWQTAEWQLLFATLIVFGLWLVFLEIDVRAILKAAQRKEPRPNA